MTKEELIEKLATKTDYEIAEWIGPLIVAVEQYRLYGNVDCANGDFVCDELTKLREG